MPFQSLEIAQSQRQKQAMVMSALQRQSLDILHLPLLALEQRIRAEAESNPAIQEVVAPQVELDAPTVDRDGVEAEKEAIENDDDFQYHDAPLHPAYDADAEERRRYMFESLRQPVSLEQHLRTQIATSNFTPDEIPVAETIVANLSSTGMLAATVGEIAEVTGSSLPVVEHVLVRMQNEFDPAGIAARNATERIVLQLREASGQYTDLAKRIATECLDDLAAGGREAAIAERLGCSRANVAAAIAVIKSLNPNPVAEFDPVDVTDYVIPEVDVVRDRTGRWIAQFNNDTAPRIVIDDGLRKFLDDETVSHEDKTYIRNHLRDAEALESSLEQRSATILKVAQAIVGRQQEFFSFGISHLKPMTLSDVADEIGRHETTVSRAASGKYLRCQRGIFELRYFFSAGLKRSDDTAAAVSNKAVMDKIAALVKAESPANPLSDQALTDILVKGGIQIKRRTVAKYREQLGIATSSKRKRH